MECPQLAGRDLLGSAKCNTLHNGLKIPFLGLGTWRLRGERLCRGLWGALQEKYALVDTAAVYGNEDEIRRFLDEAGNPRVFLTSKLQPRDARGKQAVINAFDATCKRLGVEQLDLYLIHWPGTTGVNAESQENRRLRFESWSALEELYAQKKVRAIGVSNFMVPHIEHLIADGAKVMPMVNQLEWHPMCWLPEMLKFAKAHGIVLQAYSSLGSGQGKLLEHPVVKQIAEEINHPPSVVLLRWAVQQDVLVIPCSTSQEHLRENAAALEVQLSDDQMNRLSAIQNKEQFRFCWNPNTIA